MAAVGPSLARTTSQMSSQMLNAALRRTNVDLQKAQNAISTGYNILRPSDDSSKTSAILTVQSKLEARSQHDKNLTRAFGMLNVTDSSLSDVVKQLLEAQEVGQGELGTGASAETRKSQSVVIDAMIDTMLMISNRDHDGVPLFTGNNGGNADGHAFESFLGGVRYLGTDKRLSANVGMVDALDFNTTGKKAFGAVSSRVKSEVDLNAGLQSNGKIADLAGAQNFGIRKGSVILTVDGGTPVTVDMSDIDRVDDVLTRLNNAIGGAAGSISIGAGTGGLSLTVLDGHSVKISESGAGQMAADLGIELDITAPGGGGNVITAGGDLDAKITPLTNLADFAATVDFTGGLKITQGAVTKIADLSAANGVETVQDMMNEIEKLGLGVRMEINEDGKTISLISDVSGLDFSVGEVSGGTTATDLGVRSFTGATKLSDFNFGLDQNLSGQFKTDVNDTDFKITMHDNASFEVNINGAVTVDDVLTKIRTAYNTATGNTAGAVGSGNDFNVGLNPDGNGFYFEDNTAGGSDFEIVSVNSSLATEKMGININSGAGSTIAGEDRAKVRTESVFTHLINLRDALINNDASGITIATEKIQEDNTAVTLVRADVGVRTQRVQDEQFRSSSLKITEQTMLSDLRDTNMTEVITRFTQLQNQLQATFTVGSQTLQQSFLDFLR